jgi:hypothetical protein
MAAVAESMVGREVLERSKRIGGPKERVMRWGQRKASSKSRLRMEPSMQAG